METDLKKRGKKKRARGTRGEKRGDLEIKAEKRHRHHKAQAQVSAAAGGGAYRGCGTRGTRTLGDVVFLAVGSPIRGPRLHWTKVKYGMMMKNWMEMMKNQAKTQPFFI